MAQQQTRGSWRLDGGDPGSQGRPSAPRTFSGGFGDLRMGPFFFSFMCAGLQVHPSIIL